MGSKYPVRNPDIVIRREKEEALSFNPADGNMICMNKTGILVWDLCDGANTFDDIVAKIVEKFEVSREKAEEDCEKFVKELEEAGFLGVKI